MIGLARDVPAFCAQNFFHLFSFRINGQADELLDIEAIDAFELLHFLTDGTAIPHSKLEINCAEEYPMALLTSLCERPASWRHSYWILAHGHISSSDIWWFRSQKRFGAVSNRYLAKYLEKCERVENRIANSPHEW